MGVPLSVKASWVGHTHFLHTYTHTRARAHTHTGRGGGREREVEREHYTDANVYHWKRDYMYTVLEPTLIMEDRSTKVRLLGEFETGSRPYTSG